MENFPALDPVALPAPVFIFKLLLLLTSTLHFAAVEIFLGGLLLAVVFNRLGSAQSRCTPSGNENLSAAHVLAHSLPVVMTFLINFAIPPLLFVQVLYGSALYTSSILIGAYWISVIGILMFCYWLLYKFSFHCSQGEKAFWIGILAWIAAAIVGKILSLNMTLMLRPEVWPEMYAANASGTLLPTDDPSLFPRWCFMILGGLTGAGIWTLWLQSRPTKDPSIRTRLSKIGCYLILVGIPIQLLLAVWIWKSQPDFIRTHSTESGLLGTGAVLFALICILLLVLTWNRSRMEDSLPKAKRLNLIIFFTWLVGALFAAIARDSIRDLTLRQSGYDLWSRAESVQGNYFVLTFFFIIFILGLGVTGWLIRVLQKSKPTSDRIVAPVSDKGFLVPMEPSNSAKTSPKKTDSTAHIDTCTHKMSRGAFLGTALAGASLIYTGGTAYTLYHYIDKHISLNPQKDTGEPTQDSLLLKDAASLPAKSALSFNFNHRFSLLIHHADDNWTAIEGICTHQGCKVQYEPAKNRIFCPCHNGVFDPVKGTVISGPPKEPLPLLALEIKGKDILISKLTKNS